MIVNTISYVILYMIAVAAILTLFASVIGLVVWVCAIVLRAMTRLLRWILLDGAIRQ